MLAGRAQRQTWREAEEEEEEAEEKEERRSGRPGATHPEVAQELQQAGAVIVLHRPAGLCRVRPSASRFPREGAALPSGLVTQESSSR